MAGDAHPIAWQIAVQTVLLGTAVFVLGQIIQRFVLEAIQEQRRTIGEIASAILYLGNIAQAASQIGREQQILYPEDPPQASRTLRNLASRLRELMDDTSVRSMVDSRADSEASNGPGGLEESDRLVE